VAVAVAQPLSIAFDKAAMPRPGLGSTCGIRTPDRNSCRALSGFETLVPRVRVMFEHSCFLSADAFGSPHPYTANAKRTISPFRVTVHARPFGPSIRSTTTCSVGRGIGSACSMSALAVISDFGLGRLGATRLKT